MKDIVLTLALSIVLLFSFSFVFLNSVDRNLTTKVSANALEIKSLDLKVESPKFANNAPAMKVEDLPKNINVQEIVITKTSPQDNDALPETEKRPFIYVEFRPNADIDKTKTYLKLNGQAVEYEVGSNSIYYRPKENIPGSTVKAEVKLVTKEGYEQNRNWTFTLPTSTNPVKEIKPAKNDKILGLPKPVGLIILAAIIITLLGMILYFFVKLIKTIREERQGNLEADFTDYYDYKTPINQHNTYTASSTIGAASSQTSTAVQATQQAPDMNQYLNSNAVQPATTQVTLPSTQQTAQINQPILPNLQPITPAPSDPFIEEMKKRYSIENPSQNSQQNLGVS